MYAIAFVLTDNWFICNLTLNKVIPASLRKDSMTNVCKVIWSRNGVFSPSTTSSETKTNTIQASPCPVSNWPSKSSVLIEWSLCLTSKTKDTLTVTISTIHRKLQNAYAVKRANQCFNSSQRVEYLLKVHFICFSKVLSYLLQTCLWSYSLRNVGVCLCKDLQDQIAWVPRSICCLFA